MSALAQWKLDAAAAMLPPPLNEKEADYWYRCAMNHQLWADAAEAAGDDPRRFRLNVERCMDRTGNPPRRPSPSEFSPKEATPNRASGEFS